MRFDQANNKSIQEYKSNFNFKKNWLQNDKNLNGNRVVLSIAKVCYPLSGVSEVVDLTTSSGELNASQARLLIVSLLSG